jgi:hypothetical protein
LCEFLIFCPEIKENFLSVQGPAGANNQYNADVDFEEEEIGYRRSNDDGDGDGAFVTVAWLDNLAANTFYKLHNINLISIVSGSALRTRGSEFDSMP